MFEIVGKKPVSYYSKKLESQVVGTTLYLNFIAEDITGIGAKEVWISDATGFHFDDFIIGHRVNLHYGPSGKSVSYVSFVD